MGSLSRNLIFLAGTLILLVASGAIAYYNRTAAFLIITPLWLIFCLAGAYFSQGKMRLIIFYLIPFVLAFGVAEYRQAYNQTSDSKTYINFSISDPQYFQTHPLLGTAPKPDFLVHASKKTSSEVIYDVKYTINANAIRQTADFIPPGKPAALFYGGSFTFGEGVNDQETLPAYFQEYMNGELQAINMGFHGYGPHQMLVSLEHSMEEKIIAENPPRYLIYQAIPSHVARSHGFNFWDYGGPKYILDDNNNAQYTGPFHGTFNRYALSFLSRSKLLQKWFAREREITPEHTQLFTAIVAKSAQIFKERYGGQMLVLVWHYGDQEMPIYKSIQALGIPVFLVRDIITDLTAAPNKYCLHPLDPHPTPLAYRKTARWLADYITSLGIRQSAIETEVE